MSDDELEVSFPLRRELIRQPLAGAVRRIGRVFYVGTSADAISQDQIGELCTMLAQSDRLDPRQEQRLSEIECAVNLMADVLAKRDKPPRKTLAEVRGYWSRQAMLERRAEWERLRDDGWPQAEAEIAKLDARLGEDK